MFFNGKEYSSFYLNSKNYNKGFLNGKQIFGETLHPYTVRILARATAIGATPPTNIRDFDLYVRSMVDFWTAYCDVFFRFRGTGDTNFKRINLANPEGTLADFFGGYTLDISGFKGNGTDAYVDTNFNPSLLVTGQKYQLNDASRGYIIAELITSVATVEGAIGTSGVNNTSFAGGTAVSIKVNQGTSNTTSTTISGIGLKVINRTSSTDLVIYDSDIIINRNANSTVIFSGKQAVLRYANTYYNHKVSVYFMGKSIPYSVSQDVRTAENADMVNLGLTPIA